MPFSKITQYLSSTLLTGLILPVSLMAQFQSAFAVGAVTTAIEHRTAVHDNFVVVKDAVKDARAAWEANPTPQNKAILNAAVAAKATTRTKLDIARIDVQLARASKQLRRMNGVGLSPSQEDIAVQRDLQEARNRLTGLSTQMSNIDISTQSGVQQMRALRDQGVDFHDNGVRASVVRARTVNAIAAVNGSVAIMREGGLGETVESECGETIRAFSVAADASLAADEPVASSDFVSAIRCIQKVAQSADTETNNQGEIEQPSDASGVVRDCSVPAGDSGSNGSCSTKGGTCVDTAPVCGNESVCNGTLLTGYCPGDQYERCCVLAGSANVEAIGQRVNVNITTLNMLTEQRDTLNPDHKWDDRKNAIAQTINSNNMDVVGAQEVSTRGMFDDLVSLLPDYGHTSIVADSKGCAIQRTPIFFNKSRFQLVKQGCFLTSPANYLNTVVDGSGSKRRDTTWALLRDIATQKEFYVFNTHLDGLFTEVNEYGASVLARESRVLNPSNLPAFVVGDFNSSSVGENSSLAQLEDVGFKDCVELTPDNLKINDKYNTFHGFHTPAMRNNQIDKVFCPQADKLNIEEYRIINDQTLSDHFPVMISVGIDYD